MFLTLDAVFPSGATEADLCAIYRPRAGLPFTRMSLGGTPHLVWTTFAADQVDLDVRHDLTWDYLTGVIDQLCRSGVRTLRLDAVGYIGKEAGTSCFIHRVDVRFSEAPLRLRARPWCRGARRDARALAAAGGDRRHADRVYDFALPPLVLHALLGRDPARCGAGWRSAPRTASPSWTPTTGSAVVDVAGPPTPASCRAAGGRDRRLVETIHENTGGRAGRRAVTLQQSRPVSGQQHLLRRPRARDNRLPDRPGDPVVRSGHPAGLLRWPSRGTERHGAARAHPGRQRHQPARVLIARGRRTARAAARSRHPGCAASQDTPPCVRRQMRAHHQSLRDRFLLAPRNRSRLAAGRHLHVDVPPVLDESGRETVEIADVESLAGPDVIQLSSPAQKGSR